MSTSILYQIVNSLSNIDSHKYCLWSLIAMISDILLTCNLPFVRQQILRSFVSKALSFAHLIEECQRNPESFPPQL